MQRNPVGRAIVEKQQTLGWGESVVEMVSADLQRAFPGMRGFSIRNVWYMRRFFEVYGEPDFVQQVAAELKKVPKNLAIRRQPVSKFEGGAETGEFLQQIVAEIPWGHHRLILASSAILPYVFALIALRLTPHGIF